MASGSKKVILAALVGNSLIAVTKFIAASITGSSAMFSEGVHSLVDTGNQGLLLYGLKQAKKPADEHFPFGHGKEIYFWSFVVAILIFALGAGISIYEGLQHIAHPGHISNPTINYIVLSLAIVFEGGALYFAVVEFLKTKGNRSTIKAVMHGKDPSIFVVLFEDSAAMLGLVVALAGITMAQITGDTFWDGAASVVIGLILGGTAIWLAYETKSLLIGEAAEPEIVKSIKTMSMAQEGVEHVNEILTLHMGPDFVLATISVDFCNGLPAGQVEQTIQKLDTLIKEKHPRVKRVFVEAEAKYEQNLKEQ